MISMCHHMARLQTVSARCHLWEVHGATQAEVETQSSAGSPPQPPLQPCSHSKEAHPHTCTVAEVTSA